MLCDKISWACLKPYIKFVPPDGEYLSIISYASDELVERSVLSTPELKITTETLELDPITWSTNDLAVLCTSDHGLPSILPEASSTNTVSTVELASIFGTKDNSITMQSTIDKKRLL